MKKWFLLMMLLGIVCLPVCGMAETENADDADDAGYAETYDDFDWGQYEDEYEEGDDDSRYEETDDKGNLEPAFDEETGVVGEPQEEESGDDSYL